MIALLRVLSLYLLYMLLFALERGIFCGMYGIPYWSPELHGLALDASMSAYLTAIPALLLALGEFFPTWGRRIPFILTLYSGLTALLLSLIFSLDLALYGHWGFRLDTQPIFYFTSSPASALASVTFSEGIIGTVALLLWAALIFFAQWLIVKFKWQPHDSRSVLNGLLLLLFTVLLFIPMRGGVTVSTMNLSRAYFSGDTRLNHAAVNPAFSLMYAATHDSNFASQFQFYDSEEAQRIFADSALPSPTPDAPLALSHSRPDIYIIILESFSNHLFPSLGGADVALRLDSIARQGVVWDRFYAPGFRTDRGIPGILSALPAQPTVSLMKHVEKAEHLPSLAAALKSQAGYDTRYWYGGDANFTNMLAYLISAGFDRVVSDKDFPVNERLSKWGAHDDALFSRLSLDLPSPADPPRLTVVQTSSSHEPFKVPYSNPRFADNERCNAFAFTDSIVARFIDHLSHSGRPYLALLVPDHYGAWPLREDLPEIADRHHVPLIMTGNVLPAEMRGVRHDVAMQSDIPPTLLALLGLDGAMFPFGNNLADPQAPRRAWIADSDTVVLIDEAGEMHPLLLADPDNEQTDPRTRAFLQVLYSYIGAL